MAGAQQQRGTAWKRRQQGTPSEQVRSDLEETIRENRAKAAASDGDLSADFNLRLAKGQAFAKEHGLRWEGWITHGMAVAFVEQRAARANYLIKGLAARVAALEKQVTGMQAKVDHHDKHALTYAGEWQPTSTYHEGNAVSHKGQLYTALKHVIPGKSAPSSRDGSGWALMV